MKRRRTDNPMDMASDDPFHFCPLGFLSFSLLPLMTPFSFVHWLDCPYSLYDL
jgi:hypothetical protein